METALALALTAALGALVVGAFSPGSVAFWKDSPSRTYAMLVYGGVVVGLGVIIHATVDMSEYQEDREMREAAAVAEEPEPEESDDALEVRARLTGGQVHVVNTGPEVWTDCTIEINPGLVRSGWSQSVARIAPGDSVAGGLLAFTRSGGERFNPATHAVESLRVTCRTPEGTRLWLGQMR